VSPRKKASKARTPVDVRPPHAVALSALRGYVRDIRGHADENHAGLSAFRVDLPGDLAAALLDEIDRVATAAKMMVSAWEAEDVRKSILAIEDLRTAWGGQVVHTREPARKSPPEHEVLAVLPPWVRPKEHHKTNTSIFYAKPGERRVRQAIFAIDATGAMFLDLATHTPLERVDLREGDDLALPACVLETAAAEARRKARGR